MKNIYFNKNNNSIVTNFENLRLHLLSLNLSSSLNKKNIAISKSIISLKENESNATFFIFYRTNKLRLYRKKLKFIKKNKNINITNLFFKKNLNLKIKNLNLKLKKQIIILLYNKLKTYLPKLFDRRLFLFCDFIKILSLFAQKRNNVSLSLLVYMLSLIFKTLRKQKHALFVSFLKDIFDFLIKENHLIKGTKFIISGRIKGKPRASISKITLGKISLNENKAFIEYSHNHIYTRYGCFGLKLWINYKIGKKYVHTKEIKI
jgi:hypothetical protein